MTTKHKITTIVLLLFVAVLLFVARFLKNRKGEKQQLDGFEPDKKRLSYDLEWYEQAANSIYAALNRTFGNVDEQTVFNAFAYLKNQDDYKALVKAFGIRSDTVSAGYYFFGKPEIKGNLINWLQEQFWQSELQKIRKILQKIGVTTF